ncbi:MAG: class I SAM-dependent methyltransferase [Roseibium album]|uniref:class I SAM-dependent methyltransferase n=1 Tax=Roseibium album TaxID=311410 RepID=UPI0032EDE412
MDLRDPAERDGAGRSQLRNLLAKLTPSVSRDVSDFGAEDALLVAGQETSGRLKTLVVGAGDSELTVPAAARCVYTDVAVGGITQMVSDAHDIPFKNATFDVVLAIAVLEHVADPYRCADEIHRVLKPNGYVYAVTPFMQQVHMGRYDFTRFTHLGHRRLFRRFSEERSGVSNGQGMVLAWSIERYVAGFSGKRSTHSLLRSIVRFLVFPLLLTDRILAQKPGAFDAASAYYFFGRKSEKTISDRELVQSYKGLG